MRLGHLRWAKMFSGQQHPDSHQKQAEVFSQASPVEVLGFEQAKIKQAKIISHQLCGQPSYFERALAETVTVGYLRSSHDEVIQYIKENGCVYIFKEIKDEP